MLNESIAVYVATHKKIPVRLSSPYIPVQVNCVNTGEHWDGYEHDDQGINISIKNPSYSELTVLYWAWKNSKKEIKGLSHYRRFMSRWTDVSFLTREYCDLEHLEDYVITETEIIQFLVEEKYDVLTIMPQRPYPRTAREELEQFVYKKDIESMEEIIQKFYPSYEDSLYKVFNSRNISYFNMMIAHSKYFDAYCEWLFDILQRVEDATDVSQYDIQHKRLYGYLSEVLLNIYIEKNRSKCKYFVLTQPYQIIGIQKDIFLKFQRKEKIFKWLKNKHFPYLEEFYYKIMWPNLYKLKKESEQFIIGREREL